MKYSSLTQRIAGEGSAAWDIHYRAMELKASGEDIIVLSVGDPDFDTPKPIVEAAVKSLRQGYTHYSDYRGEESLREMLAQAHQTATGCNTSADNVVVQPGAQSGLFSVAQCLLEQGDEIIIPEPMYVTYEGFLGAPGATIVNVPMRPEEHFQFRVNDIANAVTPRTRAILINTPHNPTGAVVPKEAWEAIADIVQANDLWLIVDEVYASLVYEGEHFSPCSLEGMSERTVTVSSLSKSHAMTGWRLGWVIGPSELARHIGNLTLCMLYGSPTFIQHAAETALSMDESELAVMSDAYRSRRDQMYAVLQGAPGIQCHLPGGGMFMMLDIRETGLTAGQFAEYLLQHYSVSVLPGEAFGPSAAGHVRCNLGVADDELFEAAKRIATCAAALLEGE